jgi:hypothetical protein
MRNPDFTVGEALNRLDKVADAIEVGFAFVNNAGCRKGWRCDKHQSQWKHARLHRTLPQSLMNSEQVTPLSPGWSAILLG